MGKVLRMRKPPRRREAPVPPLEQPLPVGEALDVDVILSLDRDVTATLRIMGREVHAKDIDRLIQQLVLLRDSFD